MAFTLFYDNENKPNKVTVNLRESAINETEFQAKRSTMAFSFLSTVNVRVNYITEDINMPWLKSTGSRSGMGFVIKTQKCHYKNLIITNWHTIRDLKKKNGVKKVLWKYYFDSQREFKGTVVFEDTFENVALILINESDLRDKPKHSTLLLPFKGGLSDIQSAPYETDIYLTGFLSSISQPNKYPLIGNGKTARFIELRGYSNTPVLGIEFKTNVDAHFMGSPVFTSHHHLIGMVSRGCSKSYITPYQTLGKKLAQMNSAILRGESYPIEMEYLSFNIQTQILTTKEQMEYFDVERGVRVIEDIGELRQDDILLNIGSYSVQPNGGISISIKEKNSQKSHLLEVSNCMFLAYANDNKLEVGLTVKRAGGDLLKVRHLCTRFSRIVQPFEIIKSPSYLGIGGHALLPLSYGKYIADAQNKKNVFEEQIALMEDRESPGQEKVILSASPNGREPEMVCLYDGGILREMNGIVINSMRDVVLAYLRPVLIENERFLTFVINDHRLAFEVDDDLVQSLNENVGMQEKGYCCPALDSLQDEKCIEQPLYIEEDVVHCRGCRSRLGEINVKEKVLNFIANPNNCQNGRKLKE